MTLRDRRVQYETAGLDLSDLDRDPIVQWHAWYDQAASAGVAEPNGLRLLLGCEGKVDHARPVCQVLAHTVRVPW